MTEETVHIVVFSLDEQRYGLYLSSVERIIRAVMVTLLPKAPEVVLGILDVQGKIVPVFDIRKRFRLREKEMEPDDQFILAHTARRTVVLAVDEVSGVIEQDRQKIIPAEHILPGAAYVEGVVKLDDGLILIHDLDMFLSIDEEQALDRALKKTSKDKK